MNSKINMLSVFAETLSMMKQTVISSGRLFRSFWPAEANDRSPIVTDGKLEVDDRSRIRDGMSFVFCFDRESSTAWKKRGRRETGHTIVNILRPVCMESSWRKRSAGSRESCMSSEWPTQLVGGRPIQSSSHPGSYRHHWHECWQG